MNCGVTMLTRATMTEEQFNEMTTEEKVQMQIECFGDEEQQSEE